MSRWTGETSYPWDSRPKAVLRWLAGRVAGPFNLRIERVPDPALLVGDGSSRVLDIRTRAARVPGMVSLRRGEILYYLALAVSVRGDIIEIGSWQGRSTLFLAQACEDADNGIVHAVDHFRGNAGEEPLYVVGHEDMSDLEGGFRRNVAQAGLSHRVVLYPTTSVDAASPVRAACRGARLIHIDGLHTYDGVKTDITLYADLLLPGGLLIFDDYTVANRGLVRAVGEHLDAVPDRYRARVQDAGSLLLQRQL